MSVDTKRPNGYRKSWRKGYRPDAENERDEQRACDAWNTAHPVDTRVIYWSASKDINPKITTTRSEAQVMGGHTAVIWLTGVAGCWSLSHVEAMPAPEIGVASPDECDIEDVGEAAQFHEECGDR